MTITPLGAAVEPEVYCRKARLSAVVPASRQSAARAGSSPSVATSSSPRQAAALACRPASWAASEDSVRAKRAWASSATASRRGRVRAERGG